MATKEGTQQETRNERAARSSPSARALFVFRLPQLKVVFFHGSLFCDVLTSGDVLVSRKLRTAAMGFFFA